jgi:hypothetical protein
MNVVESWLGGMKKSNKKEEGKLILSEMLKVKENIYKKNEKGIW